MFRKARIGKLREKEKSYWTGPTGSCQLQRVKEIPGIRLQPGNELAEKRGCLIFSESRRHIK